MNLFQKREKLIKKSIILLFLELLREQRRWSRYWLHFFRGYNYFFFFGLTWFCSLSLLTAPMQFFLGANSSNCNPLRVLTTFTYLGFGSVFPGNPPCGLEFWSLVNCLNCFSMFWVANWLLHTSAANKTWSTMIFFNISSTLMFPYYGLGCSSARVIDILMSYIETYTYSVLDFDFDSHPTKSQVVSPTWVILIPIIFFASSSLSISYKIYRVLGSQHISLHCDHFLRRSHTKTGCWSTLTWEVCCLNVMLLKCVFIIFCMTEICAVKVVTKSICNTPAVF